MIQELEIKLPIKLTVLSDRVFVETSKNIKEFKFDSIRSIAICYHNPSWIVLKFRKAEKDLLLSIWNRDELVDYLIWKALPVLKESKVEVKVEREENIYVEFQKKIYLLSKMKNFYNAHRMSIGNSDNMFEVKITGSEVERILMVNQIGILVFEQDGENLEKVQNFVCLIPLVEGMEVAETKQELKISYGI